MWKGRTSGEHTLRADLFGRVVPSHVELEAVELEALLVVGREHAALPREDPLALGLDDLEAILEVGALGPLGLGVSDEEYTYPFSVVASEAAMAPRRNAPVTVTKTRLFRAGALTALAITLAAACDPRSSASTLTPRLAPRARSSTAWCRP